MRRHASIFLLVAALAMFAGGCATTSHGSDDSGFESTTPVVEPFDADDVIREGSKDLYRKPTTRPVAKVKPKVRPPAKVQVAARPPPPPRPRPELWDGKGVCEGIASFYAGKFIGRKTANGETYTGRKLTAAHRTLPFGTYVRVHNLKNGLDVIVRINDRGPFIDGRVIDLSPKAASRLHMTKDGVVPVRLDVVAAWMGEE
jgi:rare lipoprotein A